MRFFNLAKQFSTHKSDFSLRTLYPIMSLRRLNSLLCQFPAICRLIIHQTDLFHPNHNYNLVLSGFFSKKWFNMVHKCIPRPVFLFSEAQPFPASAVWMLREPETCSYVSFSVCIYEPPANNLKGKIWHTFHLKTKPKKAVCCPKVTQHIWKLFHLRKVCCSHRHHRILMKGIKIKRMLAVW